MVLDTNYFWKNNYELVIVGGGFDIKDSDGTLFGRGAKHQSGSVNRSKHGCDKHKGQGSR